jgi:hypothetical protein
MGESAVVEPPPKLKIGGSTPGSGNKKGYVPPSELLSAMRHVFECTEEEDVNERQKKCRVLWKKDEFKFTERLATLERMHRDVNERSQDRAAERAADEKEEDVPEPATEIDEGEKRVLDLIELFVREMKK